MKQIFLLLLAATSSIGVFAQGEIPVNMYTGTPDIRVNLYTLTDHDLSENFSMVYNINKYHIQGNYGTGWELVVGGSVTRVVRGLPDDFSDATRTGWLYANNFSNVLSFSNAADLSSTTYADETSDYNYINNLGYLKDTEPDLFSFSAGGISGKFMFNNSGGISLIPYQDLLIVPIYSGGTFPNPIIGWTITTNTGITYTFNETCAFSKQLTKTDNVANQYDETPLTLFDREYNQYKTTVNYTGAWMLSSINSYTGAALNYMYTGPVVVTNNGRMAQLFDAFAYSTLMTETLSTTTKRAYKITTSNGMWTNIDFGSINFYDPLRSQTKPFKSFVFSYNANQLTSIQEAGQCLKMAPYKFDYEQPDPFFVVSGTDQWGYPLWTNYLWTKPYSRLLPTIYVYPNKPLNERYRTSRITPYSGTEIILNGDGRSTGIGATWGALSRIVYPSGGESDFVFQGNNYYDATAQKDQYGGGIRLGSVTYYDGVNPQANITKSFVYTDANGHSSGRLINRPAFAVPVWEFYAPKITGNYNSSGIERTFSTLYNNGALPIAPLWRELTMVTNFDISGGETTTQGSTVGYTQVTVMRPGSGKAVYNYYVPAVYGDAATGTNPTDWVPTKMKFVRPSNLDMSILRTDINWDGSTPPAFSGEWSYPTFPSPYYDYERGLVWKKSEYNNSNTLIRTTQTSYQYIFKNNSPTTIKCLAYDLFANSKPNIYLYGAYTQLADLAKVIQTETVTTYDENNSSSNAIESVQNFYNSSYHRYVSQVKSTSADGTIYGTSFKYVQDYPYTGGGNPSDSTLWMIQSLKSLNRNSTVIEQINTVQPVNGTEQTSGAMLYKFRPLSGSNLTPFPRYQLAFRPSSLYTGFNPSNSTGNVFNYENTLYLTVSTINEYDNFGLPVSSVGEDRVTKGTLWGYNLRFPVATFTQARSGNIGFSDFETTSSASFTVTNPLKGQGRSGLNGMHPSATLTRTINKPANATNFTLSFWAKPAVGNSSITLQVILKNVLGTTLSTNNYTFNYKSGNPDYQYFTQAIDVSAMPSLFIVVVQGLSISPPVPPAAILPLLDDVGFYPDYATISSMTYDIPLGISSTTSPSGITSFSSYDSLGRIKLVMDQDHNIRKRYSYAFTGQALPSLIAAITGPPNYYVNYSIAFSAAGNPCISNVTYAWDFDNQNLFSSTGITSPTQTYSSPGSHNVKLKVTHPEFGQQLASLDYTVSYPPLAVSISDTYANSWFTFTATPSNTFGAGISYQWKQRNTGSTTWSMVGNSSTYQVKILTGSGTSVDVMCTISSNDGLAPPQTVDSTILTVTN